ncbi:MAG: ABC transporter substrate-binding protein, partial [Bdellovibrionales bacterium]|nr:ABC transporter substrate-binding protein [Bdellovibrionales bacterium]
FCWCYVSIIRLRTVRFLATIFLLCLLSGKVLALPVEKRVVSLVPSVTETLYALGAGDLLVGVTPYCDFPAQARLLPKVGGLLNPNYEAILKLRPDVVFLLNDKGPISSRLEKLSIQSVSVQNESLQQIFDSINTIGQVVEREESARNMIRDLQRRIQTIKAQVENAQKPTVLVVVGGHLGRDSFRSVYGAGKESIFDELIELAHGKNVLADLRGYPILSAESILALNPEVIVDLLPRTSAKSIAPESGLEFWDALPHVKAVKNHQVKILTAEFVINPGPRIVDTLELFAKALHG